MEYESFNKIVGNAPGLFPVEATQSYLVGVKIHDNSILPSWVQKDKIRDMKGWQVDTIPNYFVIEFKGSNLLQLDNDDAVMRWMLQRKVGSLEFTNDQLWAAFVQLEKEFFPYSTNRYESAEDFKQQDSIGYEENMAAIERILYKAVGYI